jgi:hypothetical protein
MCMSPTGYAQESSNPSPQSLPLIMRCLLDSSGMLESRLVERKAEVKTLQKSLTLSADQLAGASRERDKLQTDLTATSTSLEKSESTRVTQWQDFETYKKQSLADIRAVQAERDQAIIRANIAGVGFYVSLGGLAVAGGYIAGHSFGWW